MKKTVYVIEAEDAVRYRKSLQSVTKRMVKAFQETEDGSLRKWVNTHGPVLDELLEELGHKFR